MNVNQGVSVSTMLLPVHHWGKDQHVLLFDPQQPHNRRVLQETEQGKQLFNVINLM